jgi:hypothetical protein
MQRLSHTQYGAGSMAWLQAALFLVILSVAHGQSHARVAQELEAGSTLGKASGHARAISCTNGGWFSKLKAYTTGDRVAGLELCCQGSQSSIWYEGSSLDIRKTCQWLGIADREMRGVGLYVTRLAFVVSSRFYSKSDRTSQACRQVENHLTMFLPWDLCLLPHVVVSTRIQTQ